MEVIRVGKVYYMSASSFFFSPGAPILRSDNLVDWEYIGHSVPELPFVDRFYLDGSHHGAYGKGVWASTLRYRESNGVFYWYGPLQGTDKTFIYTAKDPTDTWTQMASIDKFYYDLGLLIDKDDTFYLAYGTKAIRVAALGPSGTHEIENRVVYESEEYLEGARMYNIQGRYYIWLTRPYAGQYALMSRSGPFGPYECRRVIGDILSPIPGSGSPHQGSLVDTPDGDWYYMAFMDGYPGGRIPILATVNFDEEGWPDIKADYSELPGAWCLEYPHTTKEKHTKRSNACFKTHLFKQSTLAHCWEWNHNPDNSKWTIRNGGLVLETGTVTKSLHLATNTLTHRTIGPKSMATFYVDASGLRDGDRAGACLFRNESAYIGIHRDEGVSRLVMVQGMRNAARTVPVGFMNGRPVALDWETTSDGTIKAKTTLTNNRVCLRIKADITPAFSHGHEKETS
ncbi:putative beta-xylosidase [Fusarium oxysporum f. sp. raphani]|uniref:Putative beta-xylosidase n=1 Tax=Fusarium oxysporum f. sp. raphani TaxID=96318 RepID=A0A8J5PM51_FUSOX|nr:putative beta-xylosidase [Fusarium oxysporum f. sp. raphani]